MRWLKGFSALVAVVLITIAPPLLLARYVGNPWPAEGLSLTAPIADGLIIGFLACVVWILWAQLVICVVVEAVAAVRSGAVDVPVPGVFGFQQHLARTLITAIAIALVAVPATGFRPATATITTPAPTPTAALAATPAAGERAPTAASSQQQHDAKTLSDQTRLVHHGVVVARDDTLWSIAEQHLGDGERWEEIADLNEGHTMVDGTVFRSADLIRPGWTIQVPGQAPATAAASTTDESSVGSAQVRVEAGDSLWAIAEDKYGDGAQWPTIWEANKGERFDDGRTFTDPDLIQPGWGLDIPGVRAAPQTETPAEKPLVAQARPATPAPPHDKVTPEPAPQPTETAEQLAAEKGSRPAETVNDVEEESTHGAAEFFTPAWMLTGLTGAGVLLAGSLLLALRRRRASQHRVRRPGRVTARTAPSLVRAEQSITVAGDTATSAIESIDVILRRLGTERAQAGAPMPRLAALELTPDALTLHLHDAAYLPAPWAGTDNHLVWTVPADIDPDTVGSDVADQPAPWPLLVTIGHDTGGSIWLLNLEDLQVAVTGDRETGHDFARYIAAEIACNPWSREATVHLVGIGTEVMPMNPERLRVHETIDGPSGETVADAVRSIDRLAHYDTDAVTARSHQVDPDSWPAHLLMADLAGTETAFEQLRDLIGAHPGRASVGLIVCGPSESAVEIHLDGHRHLSTTLLPGLLTAVGLTAGEAQGCAALLAQDDSDTATPDLEGDDGWEAWSTATGSLRDEYTVARSTTPYEPSSTLLPADDADYTRVAATTVDDLDALSPYVADRVRTQVEDADPMLDDDVSDWFDQDCDRPRLSFLGPVGVRTGGRKLERRMPYYVELLSFLATRSHGATVDEVSTAFGITPARIRTDINKLRDWLGINPRTSEPFIPDARHAPRAKDRGVAVYQVVDLLIDMDLFRRLRLRGQAKGESGIEDLCRALQLVTGRPFDKLRPTGWSWLLEGDRLDHHMVCAIADTAHLVTTHSLHTGDLTRARTATEIGLLAAPDEEIPHLDLAAVLKAEGHHHEAARIIGGDVCNRSDDGEPPLELSERTIQIIEEHQWLHPTTAAM